jgi:hypothetical protein
MVLGVGMSNDTLITDALAALKTRLATIASPAPAYIYADPAAVVSIADFPAIILGVDPEREDHAFMRKGVGVALYQFYAAIWVLVGSYELGQLPALHSSCLQWPVPIGVALVSDQRLSNTVSWSGEGGAVGTLFTHSGPQGIQWADGNYFGMKFSLSLSIKMATAFG